MSITAETSPDEQAIAFALHIANHPHQGSGTVALSDSYKVGLVEMPKEGRVRLIRDLGSLASHDRAGKKKVMARVRKDGRLKEVDGSGRLVVSEAGIEFQWTPFFGWNESMTDYALLLLLDEKREFGKLLHRCEMKTCNRFFIAERAGRQGKHPHKYCAACRENAYAIKNKERVAAKRAGMPVVEWRRKHK